MTTEATFPQESIGVGGHVWNGKQLVLWNPAESPVVSSNPPLPVSMGLTRARDDLASKTGVMVRQDG